jgi:hypothetical protein
MERNINVTTGKCGIAMMSSYPTKKGANPPKPSPTPPTPPTPPPPVAPDHVCDENQSCPAGSTCCCAFGFRNHCLLWGCCPAEGATCCKDHASCCPPDYPVCNIRAGTCSVVMTSTFRVYSLCTIKVFSSCKVDSSEKPCHMHDQTNRVYVVMIFLKYIVLD